MINVSSWFGSKNPRASNEKKVTISKVKAKQNAVKKQPISALFSRRNSPVSVRMSQPVKNVTPKKKTQIRSSRSAPKTKQSISAQFDSLFKANA